MEFAELLHRERVHAADEWFELGVELEPVTPGDARNAYVKALSIEPHHTDALVNLGRLIHEDGDPAEAAQHYLTALECDSLHTTAAFNLGVAYEDLGRTAEALNAYRHCIAADERFADAHFNLAALLERSGDQHGAIRHFTWYRNLVKS